ncbi:MAG: VOC family protein [Spirochaetales bacterium]|nr:VOC family protein [Spirochaetales bacterium]
MKLEHTAINVSDPVSMAGWYKDNLGMEIVKAMTDGTLTHFLRDSGGMMMLEIYRNPPDKIPDYKEMDPLILHFAFVSENPELDSLRLCAAGASVEEDLLLDDGSRLIMMKDPWGINIQLCKRTNPLLSGR